ncbi:hypothetical protein GCM10022243_05820 [Saccharothrix violaceirubra]|uniref:Uncharacterized protein n=1 Tax=Saccharothrix violaceirubra TaxID=413306 RepID=A0A7W7SXX8_9PSEU|nr:hypothetical protein [Saccharothrix violaceirubra]
MRGSTTATVAALGVGAAGESTSAPTRVLPVRGELAGLLPWGGLRRGSTVSVRASASLLLTLIAAATAEGSWAVVAGLPRCGALAAVEVGVAVHRLALVPRPGRDRGEVDRTVAALLDGFDIVAVATPVSAASARKLSNRARVRKAVLVPFGLDWPGADVELTPSFGPWNGLSPDGGTPLRTRTLTVHATGRGAAARPRSTTFPLLLRTRVLHPDTLKVPRPHKRASYTFRHHEMCTRTPRVVRSGTANHALGACLPEACGPQGGEHLRVSPRTREDGSRPRPLARTFTRRPLHPERASPPLGHPEIRTRAVRDGAVRGSASRESCVRTPRVVRSEPRIAAFRNLYRV